MNKLKNFWKLIVLIWKHSDQLFRLISKMLETLPALGDNMKKAGDSMVQTSYLLDGSDGRAISIKKIADDLKGVANQVNETSLTLSSAQAEIDQNIRSLTLPIPEWTEEEREVFNFNGISIGKIKIFVLKTGNLRVFDKIPDLGRIFFRLNNTSKALEPYLENQYFSFQNLPDLAQLVSSSGENLRNAGKDLKETGEILADINEP